MTDQLSLTGPNLGRLRCRCGRTPTVWWERRATEEEIETGVAVVAADPPTVRFCPICAREHAGSGGKVRQCPG